jgi:hypothetical protein
MAMAKPVYNSSAVLDGNKFSEYHTSEWGLEHFVSQALAGNWTELGYEDAIEFAKTFEGQKGWKLTVEVDDETVVLWDAGCKNNKKRATGVKEEKEATGGTLAREKRLVVQWPGDTPGKFALGSKELRIYSNYLTVNLSLVKLDVKNGTEEVKQKASSFLDLMNKVRGKNEECVLFGNVWKSDCSFSFVTL